MKIIFPTKWRKLPMFTQRGTDTDPNRNCDWAPILLMPICGELCLHSQKSEAWKGPAILFDMALRQSPLDSLWNHPCWEPYQGLAPCPMTLGRLVVVFPRAKASGRRAGRCGVERFPKHQARLQEDLKSPREELSGGRGLFRFSQRPRRKNDRPPNLLLLLENQCAACRMLALQVHGTWVCWALSSIIYIYIYIHTHTYIT